MNIIIGIENISQVKDKHIVLPLDTFITDKIGNTVTAYCVIENVPIDELPSVEHNTKMHNELLQFYADKRWDDCSTILDHLLGCWGGEVDSFYSNLRGRINQLNSKEIPENWTPFLMRQSKTT